MYRSSGSSLETGFSIQAKASGSVEEKGYNNTFLLLRRRNIVMLKEYFINSMIKLNEFQIGGGFLFWALLFWEEPDLVDALIHFFMSF